MNYPTCGNLHCARIKDIIRSHFMKNAKTAFFLIWFKLDREKRIFVPCRKLWDSITNKDTNMLYLIVGSHIRNERCFPATLPVATAPAASLSWSGDPPSQQATGQTTICFL